MVKPVREQRLVQALEHAKVRLRERRAARWAESVALSEARSDAPASTTPATEGEGPLRKVLAHLRGQTVFVDVGQIACIEAEDYHTRVHTAAESYLLRHSMSWFENRLPATQFVRIHRSYIVNIDQIVALKPWSGGSYDVFLAGGRQARLSAARKSDLERVIGQTF